MPEGKRTFKVGERIADIPAEKIDGFMQTHPDAIEVKSFIVDKDTADIPLDKVDGFLKAYPNAKPLYSDNTMGKSMPEGGALKPSGGQSQSKKLDIATATELALLREDYMRKGDGAGFLREVATNPKYKRANELLKQTQGKDGLGLMQMAQQLDADELKSVQRVAAPRSEIYKQTREFLKQKAKASESKISELEGVVQAGEQVIQTINRLNEQGETEAAKQVYEENKGVVDNYSQIANDYNTAVDEYKRTKAGISSLNYVIPKTKQTLTPTEYYNWLDKKFESKKESDPMGSLLRGAKQPITGIFNTLATLEGQVGDILESVGLEDNFLQKASSDLKTELTIDKLLTDSEKTAKEMKGIFTEGLNSDNALSAIGNVLGYMAIGATTGGSAVGMASSMYGDSYDAAKEAGLSEVESAAYALTVSSVMGVLEKYLGTGRLIKGLVGDAEKLGAKQLSKVLLEQAKKEGAKGGMEIAKTAANMLYKTGVEAGVQGLDEAIQGGAEVGAKILSNKAFDGNFDVLGVDKNGRPVELNMGNLFNYLGDQALAGVVGGGLPSIGVGIRQSTNLNERIIATASEFVFDPKAEESFMQTIQDMVGSGEIQPEQVETIVAGLESAKAASLRIPKEIPDGLVRQKMVALMGEKTQLEQELKTADPLLSDGLNTRLNEINDEIKGLYDTFNGKSAEPAVEATEQVAETVVEETAEIPEIEEDLQIEFFNNLGIVDEPMSEKTIIRDKNGKRLLSIAEITALSKEKKERSERMEAAKQKFAAAREAAKKKLEQTTLEAEKERQDFIQKQREQRDKEVEEIQKIRKDLGTEAELVDMIPNSVDRVIDRMDAGIPSDNVAIEESIKALDGVFDKLQAYKNDPKRTHTIAQIDAVIDILSDTKSEIQQYQKINAGYETDKREISANTKGEPKVATAKSTQGQTIVEQPTTQPAGEVAVNTQTDEVIRNEEGRQEGRQELQVSAPPVVEQTTADVGGEKAPDVSTKQQTTPSKQRSETVETKAKEPAKEQKTEDKQQGNPALRDVESTAKALEGVELKPNEVSEFNDDWVSKRIFKEDSFFGSKAKINVLRATRDDIISSLSSKQQTEIIEIYEAEMQRLQGNPYAKDAAIERVFDKLNEYAPSLKKRFEKQTKGAEPFKEYLNDAIVKIKELRERSKAYHKAKADGSNPELVKAVEELLTPNKDEKANTEKASTEGGMLEGLQDGRTQDEGRKESAELRAKEEVEELLTPKTEQDAKEQQSGQMREQSVQETTKRSGDSDLPKVNETKLSDGKKTSKEQKLNESKENFKKAFKKWTDINKEIGISPDVRKKAQADIDLFNSAIQLVKDYAEYGVEKLSEIIKEATKDIFDGKITQRQKDIISDAFEFVKSGKRPDRYVPENAYLRAMQDAYKQGVEATEAEFKQKMGDLKSDFKEFMQFVAEQNKEETKSKLDSKSAKFKAFRKGQKAFAKVFNDTLKSAQEKNFITPFEYRMLARRASLAQTEGQWNKLMDLTNRVLSDASYRSKLAEAERLQKQAKQKKHGQATEEVKRFTRISPEDIDINKLDEYIAALGDLTLPIPKYGKMQAIVFEIEDNFRRSNPDLFTGRTDSSISGSEKVNKAFEKASEAFDNVMESLNKDAITVDDYRYAVKQAGIALRNLDLVIADMRTMYEDDKLTPEALEEAENMYLDVLDSIGTSVADLSAKFPSQIDQLVTELVNQVNDNLPKIDKSTLTNSEKDMLKKLELYNSADLKKLSPIELDFYNQLIENFLNEGYFDMQRFKAVQSALFAATNKDKTVKFVNDIKQVFDDRFDNMPPANRLAAQVSATWQGALTGFGKLFAGAFDVGFISPIMTSLKKADEETRKIVRELRDLQRKHGIQESAIFGKESYRERAHRIGMVAAYLREYGLVLSGDPRKVDKKEGGQMEGERDVFRRLSDEKGTVVATGEKSEKSKDPKGEYDYGSKTEDKKLDQKIYKSFPKSKTVVDNGVEYKEVDPKEVYDSIFTEPNNKFLNAKERAFLIDYYKLLEKTRDLQQAANAMRGLPFKPVTLYSPRQRYSTRSTSGLVPFPILKGGRISLRGSSGKEVVTEELSAMNNNIFDVFLQNAEETMRDYYVTSAVMDVNSLYKSVMPEIENDNGKYVKAMMDKISDSLNDHYIFPPKDIVQRTLNNFTKIGTFRIFVNVLRTAAEIFSFSTTGALRMGTGYKAYRNFAETVKLKSQVTALMNDVNSMFTGSMISKDIEFKEGRIEAERLNSYFTRIFASAAESIFKRMLWYTRFQQEFKQKTGQKFDIDKYESLLDYRKKYREAIEEAKVQSDKSFEFITGSPVRAGRRKAARLLPIAGTKAVIDIDTLAGQALSLFSAYPFRGAIQAVDGLTDLKNEPSLKRANDAKNALLGTLGEQIGYGFAIGVTTLLSQIIFSDDDDEKKELQKELDGMFTLNELGLETLTSAVGMLSASMNGAGRILMKVIGTIAYTNTDNEAKKKMIVQFMQKVQYGKLTDYSKIKNDLKLKQAIYIDLIESSGLLGLTEVARLTIESYNAYKDFNQLMDVYENGTPAQKEKATDTIIMMYLMVKAVNVIGALAAFKGMAFNLNSKSLNQMANQELIDAIPSRDFANEMRKANTKNRSVQDILELQEVSLLMDTDESNLYDQLVRLQKKSEIMLDKYKYNGEQYIKAIKKQVSNMMAEKLDSGGQNIETLRDYSSEQQLDTDKAFDVMFLFANRGDKKEKALRIALLKTILKLPETQEGRLKQKVEGGYDNSYYNSILKNDAQTIFEFIKFMKKQNKL